MIGPHVRPEEWDCPSLDREEIVVEARGYVHGVHGAYLSTRYRYIVVFESTRYVA